MSSYQELLEADSTMWRHATNAINNFKTAMGIEKNGPHHQLMSLAATQMAEHYEKKGDHNAATVYRAVADFHRDQV